MKTEHYRAFGGFRGFDIHADLALLNKIVTGVGAGFTEEVHHGKFLVNYDLGGVSNSGENALKSLRELIAIFLIYSNGLWRLGHFKALLRPLLYKVRSLGS